MDIRYFLIVKLFGLKTGIRKRKGEAGHSTDHSLQNSFGEISIIIRNENEIVMGDDDRHLYYRLSVLKRGTGKYNEICLTTVVRFHNTWGRAYFTMIKPFHKIIVRYMLKKI